MALAAEAAAPRGPPNSPAMARPAACASRARRAAARDHDHEISYLPALMRDVTDALFPAFPAATLLSGPVEDGMLAAIAAAPLPSLPPTATRRAP
ncbi:hypothetical protein [Teichococcus aestuarii]|uniref:hypothetical protein n=1 Tax=Teichococcus aestuarii TaxID=568898 RepID=UPI0036080DA5